MKSCWLGLITEIRVRESYMASLGMQSIIVKAFFYTSICLPYDRHLIYMLANHFSTFY